MVNVKMKLTTCTDINFIFHRNGMDLYSCEILNFYFPFLSCYIFPYFRGISIIQDAIVLSHAHRNLFLLSGCTEQLVKVV